MLRALVASFALLTLTGLPAHAQAPAGDGFREGQRVVGKFRLPKRSDSIDGLFTLSTVKGNVIEGMFSGPLCGPRSYWFGGKFDGDSLTVRSTSRWGPITVVASRVAPNRFVGTFTGPYDGTVELTVSD